MSSRFARVCLGAGLICSAAVHAAPASIHIAYLEPVVFLEPQSGVDSARKPETGSKLVFDAFGRRFEAELEPNDSLVRRLSPDVREALGARRLLRGTLTGLPGSWVRFSEHGGHFAGVLWDGQNLYAVMPFGAVREHVSIVLPLSDTAPVVYRLSDIEGIAGQFCDLVEKPGSDLAASVYERLTAELSASAAAAGVVEHELEVAVLGDAFFVQFTGDAVGEMLERMNIVDGIFASQAGISIVATDLVKFNTSSDPFTSNDAEILLDQLGAYRQATAGIRDRGLTHLLTGRDLDGNTAGIAYRDSLCDPYFGVSLSESSFDRMTSALVIAHELGHNFGSPHDGEAGACVAEPRTYLMAPQINNSGTFSACTLAIVESGIEAAACVRPASRIDAAVEAPQSVLRGEVFSAVEYPVDVIAVGARAVRDVEVTFTFPDSLTVGGLPFDVDLQCSYGSGVARCRLPWVAPNRPRRLVLNLIPNVPGTFRSDVEIVAAQDENTANNRAHVDIIVDRGGDVGIRPANAQVDGATRDPVRIPFEIEVLGPEAPAEPRLTIDAQLLSIQAIEVTGASCTVAREKAECALGALTAGATIAGELTVVGERYGYHPVYLSVGAANDRNPTNNFAQARVMLVATYDLAAYFADSVAEAVVGEIFSSEAVVTTHGLTASTGVELEITAPTEVTLHSASLTGGTCSIAADRRTARCSVSRIEPQSFETLAIRASTATRGIYSVQLRGSADLDDAPGNEVPYLTVRSTHPVDGALSYYGSWTFVESFQGFGDIEVRNVGANAMLDARFEVELPNGLVWDSAARTGAPCSAAGQRVICPIESSTIHDSSTLIIRSDLPGSYTVPVRLIVPGDADLSDNTLEIPVTVLPFIDVGIDPLPETIEARSGRAFTVPIVIRTDRRPVSDVRLSLNLPLQVVFDPANSSTTVGSCSPQVSLSVDCLFGPLPAYTDVRLELSFVSRNLQDEPLTASVYVSNDVVHTNDRRTVQIRTERGGDGSVAVARTAIDARIDTDFNYPTITVSGLETIEQATVRVSLDPSFAVVSMASSAGTCHAETGSSSGVLCSLGTLEAGSSRRIDLRLRGSRTGDFNTLVQLDALDDDGPENNSERVLVSMSNAPPPSGGGSGGGGGGGGALDVWSLLAGVALCLAQRRRRRALHA